MSEEKKQETTEETGKAPAEETPGADAGATTATADENAGAVPETEAGAESAETGAETGAGDDAVDADATPASAGGADGEEVRQVALESLQDTAASEAGVDNWGLVLDVVVPVSVDLGRATMAIRDVMRIRAGSVVTLDKPLGEPVDLRINGEVIGRGEVVVVGDQIGIQIVDLKQKGRSK